MVIIDIPKIAICLLAIVQTIWFVIATLEFLSESNEWNAGTMVGSAIVLSLVVTVALRIFGIW